MESIFVQIPKLVDEGFIVLQDNRLSIKGYISAHQWSEPVYRGGINREEIHISFKREGRRKEYKVSLVDILEYFRFNYGEIRLEIERERDGP